MNMDSYTMYLVKQYLVRMERDIIRKNGEIYKYKQF